MQIRISGPAGDAITQDADFLRLAQYGGITAQAVSNADEIDLTISSAISRGALDRRLLARASTVLTTFQSGHGWTSSVGVGSPTFNLNDTSDFVLGSQCVSITCPNVNDAGYVSKTSGFSIDSTGKVPRLWVKATNLATLFSVVLYLGDTTFTNFWQWNVWQSGSTQMVLDGEWAIITLPWSAATVTGSPNRAAITGARVRYNNGPTTTGTVFVNGIDFVSTPSSAWPNGVVTFRFDDGWASQYTEARKKLDQYLYPATAYPIAEAVNNATAGVSGYSGIYQTIAQLQALEANNGWEVGNHAYRLVNHDAPLGTLDAATVEAEFSAMRAWSQANGFHGGGHFAWPQGVFNATSLSLARRYFSSLCTIYEKHQETLPCADRYRLRIRNVINTTTTGSIQTDIDNAFANGHWLILLFHKIVTSPAQATEYSIANFATVVDYVNTKTIPCRTVGDVLASL